MSSLIDKPRQGPVRPSYHNGMLLDADDFREEQRYHIDQLARVARFLHGSGTAAGLEVRYLAADADGHTAGELVVRPGVAIDRVGRVIELRKPWCLRLDRWLAHEVAERPALQPLVDGAERHLVADVFVRYIDAPRELRPAFRAADGDATDSVVAARLEDAFVLELVARDHTFGAPSPPDKPFATPITSRSELLSAIFAAYQPPSTDGTPLAPLPEHPPSYDPHALFLARLRIRLVDAPAVELARHADQAVEVDNEARPIATQVALLFALSSLA
jgi:hypothetical protein